MTRISSAAIAATAMAACLAAPANADLINVALGADVSVVGTTNAPFSADPSTITDGIFLPNGTPTFLNPFVFNWTGDFTAIFIDLGDVYEIVAASMQADDGDEYLLYGAESYADGFELLWTVPDVSGGSDTGLRTRPDPSDPSAVFTLPTPTPVRYLYIRNAPEYNPFGQFAISEVQVFTPAPSASLCLASAGLLLAVRRRRG